MLQSKQIQKCNTWFLCKCFQDIDNYFEVFKHMQGFEAPVPESFTCGCQHVEFKNCQGFQAPVPALPSQ